MCEKSLKGVLSELLITEVGQGNKTGWKDDGNLKTQTLDWVVKQGKASNSEIRAFMIKLTQGREMDPKADRGWYSSYFSDAGGYWGNPVKKAVLMYPTKDDPRFLVKDKKSGKYFVTSEKWIAGRDKQEDRDLENIYQKLAKINDIYSDKFNSTLEYIQDAIGVESADVGGSWWEKNKTKWENTKYWDRISIVQEYAAAERAHLRGKNIWDSSVEALTR